MSKELVGTLKLIAVSQKNPSIAWLKNPDDTETAVQVKPGTYTGFSLAIALTKAARALGYSGHFTYSRKHDSFTYLHKNKKHGDVLFLWKETE